MAYEEPILPIYNFQNIDTERKGVYEFLYILYIFKQIQEQLI